MFVPHLIHKLCVCESVCVCVCVSVCVSVCLCLCLYTLFVHTRMIVPTCHLHVLTFTYAHFLLHVSHSGLHKAMSKREIEELEKAMAFVRKYGFESELAQEMHSAGKLLTRLRRLERIRHEILELKQSTVAEIRSYTSPPPIVHTVMTAVFLLLGHAEKETKVPIVAGSNKTRV